MRKQINLEHRKESVSVPLVQGRDVFFYVPPGLGTSRAVVLLSARTLKLPTGTSPIPWKYRCPLGFSKWGAPETRKAPSPDGAFSIFGAEQKKSALRNFSENAPLS
jgi:hypothetical protein